MILAGASNVKIYDLSSGRSLPEWLTERKRRTLLKKDGGLRRRIELIQGFEMPDCSNNVALSKDNQFAFVSGIYKPRIRCFDLSNLSEKFERCLDSEPLKLIPLSDGYEKFVILEEDRWVEFHVQHGFYHKLRVPKFIHDAAYIESIGELYVVTSGSEIYRLNLELGRFMTPMPTTASSMSSCDISSVHQLFVCGTDEGIVEAWDPRVEKCVGRLPVCANEKNLPIGANGGVTRVKFRDGLNLAAGTGFGKIFMYDIRSSKPLIVKDHQYDLPIISINFCDEPDLVMSMDNRALKIWHRDQTAATYATIEPGPMLHDLCVVPNSGLLFMANEKQKVLSYFLPSLGPAPKWCSFLDNIVEELEETQTQVMYDDYKFLSRNELDELGLTNLIGSKMLRAYMHGYFCDIRLYNKAKSLVNPFAFEEYRKNKIKEKLTEQRTRKATKKNVVKVNRALAERLETEQKKPSKFRRKNGNVDDDDEAPQTSLLNDTRFRDLFENPEFEVDMDKDDIQTLNPALTKLHELKYKLKRKDEAAEIEERNLKARAEFESNFVDKVRISEPGSSDIEDSNSDDDDIKVKKDEVESKKKKKKLDRKARQPKMYTLKEGEDFSGWKLKDNKLAQFDNKTSSLGERIMRRSRTDGNVRELVGDAREITFTVKEPEKISTRSKKNAEHIEERKKVRRSALSIMSKPKPRKNPFYRKK